MFNYPGIDKELLSIAEEKERELSDIYRSIDEISEANQFKVLSAFIKNRVCEADFNSGSGYGYNEIGREKLEQVYADIFHTESALVRLQFVNGTHALTAALFAMAFPPYFSVRLSLMSSTRPSFSASRRLTKRWSLPFWAWT